jgi:DNA primase
MSREAIDELKRQIPLLDYLQANGWRPARQLNGSRCMGLCPLYPDRKPSFLVDSGKSLFYLLWLRTGWRVIRFVELSCNVRFPEAVVLLHQSCGVSSLLDATIRFIRTSCIAAAKQSRISASAESIRQKSFDICASAMHQVLACVRG